MSWLSMAAKKSVFGLILSEFLNVTVSPSCNGAKCCRLCATFWDLYLTTLKFMIFFLHFHLCVVHFYPLYVHVYDFFAQFPAQNFNNYSGDGAKNLHLECLDTVFFPISEVCTRGVTLQSQPSCHIKKSTCTGCYHGPASWVNPSKRGGVDGVFQGQPEEKPRPYRLFCLDLHSI